MSDTACPYCDKEVAARGAKNHVRLSTGNGHGDKGEVPASYQEDVEQADVPADSVEDETGTETPDETEDADGQSDGADSVEEVTADTLGNTQPEQPESSGEQADNDGLPFDPDADGAVELDGGEELYVRHNGEVTKTTADKGDWLLMTDSGPVLYDPDQDARFEVVTE